MKYRFRAAKSFRRALARLSPEDKRLALAAFKIFKQNPFDPGCGPTRSTGSRRSTAKPFTRWRSRAICGRSFMWKIKPFGASISETTEFTAVNERFSTEDNPPRRVNCGNEDGVVFGYPLSVIRYPLSGGRGQRTANFHLLSPAMATASRWKKADSRIFYRRQRR